MKLLLCVEATKKLFTYIDFAFLKGSKMTKIEMKNIADEITYIDEKLSILSPDNPIENQKKEWLLQRLNFLEHKIDCALLSVRRNRLRVVAS